MARYKADKRDQQIFVSVYLDQQLLPGTFEHALNHLIDAKLDLAAFDAWYCNDDTGAPAYDPAIPLKVVLFAYSRGILSSRQIAHFGPEDFIFDPDALTCLCPTAKALHLKNRNARIGDCSDEAVAFQAANGAAPKRRSFQPRLKPCRNRQRESSAAKNAFFYSLVMRHRNVIEFIK